MYGSQTQRRTNDSLAQPASQKLRAELLDVKKQVTKFRKGDHAKTT
jgi:hypothetical protein